MSEGLARLNALPEADAREALTRCCGASRWVDAMLSRRPFATTELLFEAADDLWARMRREDILEAFRHHPKIGDVDSLRKKFASTATWASGEQAGAVGAPEDVLAALAKGNAAYEERFGHIFIVCATGKTAAEMLAILESRLPNEPAGELALAAEEQRRITRLRLEKLVTS